MYTDRLGQRRLERLSRLNAERSARVLFPVLSVGGSFVASFTWIWRSVTAHSGIERLIRKIELETKLVTPGTRSPSIAELGARRRCATGRCKSRGRHPLSSRLQPSSPASWPFHRERGPRRLVSPLPPRQLPETSARTLYDGPAVIWRMRRADGHKIGLGWRLASDRTMRLRRGVV